MTIISTAQRSLLAPWNRCSAIIALAVCRASTPHAASQVIAWGNNSSGQTNVPLDLTDAVAIAGGAVHSLALRSDGTVAAWGRNAFGQTNVPAGLTLVTAIGAGAVHNIALKNDGTVVAWGG